MEQAFFWLAVLIWVWNAIKVAAVLGLIYLVYWFGRNKVSIKVTKRD